jgi:hypothetical protein
MYPPPPPPPAPLPLTFSREAPGMKKLPHERERERGKVCIWNSRSFDPESPRVINQLEPAQPFLHPVVNTTDSPSSHQPQTARENVLRQGPLHGDCVCVCVYVCVCVSNVWIRMKWQTALLSSRHGHAAWSMYSIYACTSSSQSHQKMLSLNQTRQRLKANSHKFPRPHNRRQPSSR